MVGDTEEEEDPASPREGDENSLKLVKKVLQLKSTISDQQKKIADLVIELDKSHQTAHGLEGVIEDRQVQIQKEQDIAEELRDVLRSLGSEYSDYNTLDEYQEAVEQTKAKF